MTYIQPSWEIEQVGVEQRGEDVLDHDQQADPLGKAVAAKQQEMTDPDRVENEDADNAHCTRRAASGYADRKHPDALNP